MKVRGSIILFISALAALLAGWLLSQETTRTLSPCQYELQQELTQEYQQLTAAFGDTLLPAYFSPDRSLRYLSETQQTVEQLEELRKQDMALFLYQQDSLLTWTSQEPLRVEHTGFSGTHFWRKPHLYLKHPIQADRYWIGRLTLPSGACAHTVDSMGIAQQQLVLSFSRDTNSGIPRRAVLCYWLGLALLLTAGYRLAGSLFQRGQRGAGAATWLLITAGVILLSLHIEALRMPVFWLTEPIWTADFLGPSLLHFLSQSIVLLLSMILYRRFWYPAFRSLPLWLRWILALLGYAQISGFFLVILIGLHYLVAESSVWLELDNIFYLNRYTLGTCAGIGLWMISWFLFSHRQVSLIRQWLPGINQRALAILAAVLITLITLILLPLAWSPWLLGPILLLYFLLFDWFFDRDEQSLTWFMVWLIGFSALTAGILYRYSLDREQSTMEAYAKKLAHPRDSLLQERLIHYLSLSDAERLPRIKSDPYVNQFYSTSQGVSPPPSVNNAREGVMVERRINGKDRYWLIGSADTLSLERRSGVIRPYRPYADLLGTAPYRGLIQLDRYQYLVFRKQNIVEQSGLPRRTLMNIAEQIPVDRTQSTLSGRQLSVLYRFGESEWVLLERELGGYFKPMSLFAYFFLLFLTLSILLAVIGPVLYLSQQTLNTLFSSTASLRTKIQLWVLGLIIFSFIAIAMLTISSFRRSAAEDQETRLLQRVGRMRGSLQDSLTQTPGILASSERLDQLARNLLEQYQLDINLYNRKGRQIASSQSGIPLVYATRNRLMHPAAFESLRTGLEDFRIIPEQWGSVRYKTVYVPIESRGILYMEVPYYAQNREMQDGLYDFMGSLFSLYAFALLVAAAVTLLVSRSITEPLAHIREKLRGLQLDTSEHLEWDRPDEIGELILAYNEAIQKLSESTERLRKSERESAWREMAKQVAHEIKNPLTPMKLRVQHLMQAYQQDPRRAAPLIKQVSGSLIEQIDTLTRIADEFSRFAQMPKANITPFDLKQLLNSIAMLFSEEEQVSVRFESALTRAPVQADRDQLTRVFNNLIKNALQAIPPNHTGRIVITLTQNDTSWRVAVADNGTGISPDVQEKVFSPNFTTKSSGTGLGLAMARQMVEQLGGKIYFETSPGEGTVFYVELLIDTAPPAVKEANRLP